MSGGVRSASDRYDKQGEGNMAVALVIIGVSVVVALAIVLVVWLTRQQQPASPFGVEVAELHKNLGQVQQQMIDVQSQQRDVLSNVAALVTNPGKRGVWGELTLVRLLEKAGLTRGTDFDEQVDLGDVRPDVVVHLGAGGEIVVDSKARIVALKEAWEAAERKDEAGRKAAVKAFADAVRADAKELAKRDYASMLKTAFAPVVMYIPVDGAWEAAREMRGDILSEMLSLGIYPAEPSTMGMTIALLRQHALNSRQEEAVQEILGDTQRLLNALRIHVNHLDKVGTSLGKAVESFDHAVGNMDRNVLPATGRMTKHVDVQIRMPAPVERRPDMGKVERIIDKTEVA
jgi:DNA recombination protein RmuC